MLDDSLDERVLHSGISQAVYECVAEAVKRLARVGYALFSYVSPEPLRRRVSQLSPDGL